MQYTCKYINTNSDRERQTKKQRQIKNLKMRQRKIDRERQIKNVVKKRQLEIDRQTKIPRE